MSLASGTRLGSYELRSQLGAGGLGTVYLASDTTLHRKAAVKVLERSGGEARAALLREARAASALDHPNICTVYEVGEHDGHDYMAMAFIEGKTLRQLIVEREIPLPTIFQYANQIADALAHAHARGIVHRNLKPDNIIVTPEGRVKVLDFGLASRLAPTDAEAVTRAVDTLSDAAKIVGTPAYMAPEVLCGDTATPASDIWALGVLLHEMVTRARPFEGKTTFELTAAILHAPPSPLPERLPLAAQALISRCLAKHLDQRTPRASDVLATLQALAAGPASPVPARPRLRSRRTWLVACSAALALVLGALGVDQLRDRVSGEGDGFRSIESIVALPSSVTASAEDAYLADAIPNTMSTYLTKVEGLETLLPPTSSEVEPFGGDVGRIAAAYGVSAVVVSSVVADADRLVFNVELVEAGSQHLVWSEEYEGVRGSYLELVRGAADDIRQVIRPANQLPGDVAVAASSEAEFAYQQGLFYSQRYNDQHQPNDFDVAFEAFQRALTLDPTLAVAAAEIAWLFVFRIEGGAPADEAVRDLSQWAERALAIDPNCGRAYAVLVAANVMQPGGSFLRQFQYALRAVRLDPLDALAHRTLGAVLPSCSLGMAIGREARRVDPFYLYGLNHEAASHLCLGHAEETLNVINLILELEPNLAQALVNRGQSLIELGRLEEGAAVIPVLGSRARQGLFPEFWVLGVRMLLAFERGDTDEAHALLARVLELAPPWAYHIGLPMTLTPSLGKHGQTDAVFEVLRRSLDVGFTPPYDWLMLNPNLASVRGDARFAEVASVARQQFEEVVEAVNDARSRGEFPAYLEEPLTNLLLELGMSTE